MIQVTVAPTELVADQPAELSIALTNRDSSPCLQVVFRLALPETFVRIAGADRLEVAQLEGGASRQLRLQVRPRQPGDWWLTSPNFVYRDGTGHLQRVRDFRHRLSVRPPRVTVVEPPPQVRMELVTEELPLAEWSVLRGRVTRVSGADLDRLWVRVTGRVSCAASGRWQAVQTPTSEAGSEIALQVRAEEAGESVPFGIEARFVDRLGREGGISEQWGLRVRAAASKVTEALPTPTRPPAAVRILVLLSNPAATPSLRLGAEVRDLEEELRRSRDRDRFAVFVHHAVRPKDVLRAILDVEPRIVHFSGHGDAAGALYLEDEVGAMRPVAASGFGELAGLMADTVECVVLNSCFSEIQAREMAHHLPYVIGMQRAIEDEAARNFTIGFYMALGAGKPVEIAFRYACQLVAMDGRPGSDVPRLLGRGCSASRRPDGEGSEATTPDGNRPMEARL